MKHKLIEKYGVKNEQGGFSVLPENMKAFNDELTEFLKEEIELSYMKVSVDDIPNSILSPVNLINLEMFFTEKSLS